MGRFDGRVAVVTAATRGIGFAIAERLAKEGCSVVITGRRKDALDSALARLGPNGSGMTGDVTDAEHRTAVLEHVQAVHGHLDHLVNAAGISPVFGPVTTIKLHRAQQMLEVNVLAANDWTRDAVAAGLTRSVVNIASLAGTIASPGIAFYGVTKAALINLTMQLAAELAPTIRVNAVAPAVVKTQFARRLFEGREEQEAARYPLARLGEPEDVAGPVAFLLSDDAAWMTGQTLVIDGGITQRPLG